MAAFITVLNYVYSLCVFYYNVLSCVADVADCPLPRLSAIVIETLLLLLLLFNWPRPRQTLTDVRNSIAARKTIKFPTNG